MWGSCIFRIQGSPWRPVVKMIIYLGTCISSLNMWTHFSCRSDSKLSGIQPFLSTLYRFGFTFLDLSPLIWRWIGVLENAFHSRREEGIFSLLYINIVLSFLSIGINIVSSFFVCFYFCHWCTYGYSFKSSCDNKELNWSKFIGYRHTVLFIQILNVKTVVIQSI